MNEKYLIPLSILLAGLLVGAGIFWTQRPEGTKEKNSQEIAETQSFRKQKIALVDIEQDHIIGNPETAELFIVEYADLECPGCKIYHKETLLPLIEKYSKDKVAFVFRHFPFDKSYGGQEPLHPTAGEEARATECAYEQGGNKKFFEYVNKIFAETKSDGKFPLHRLPVIAEELDLDKEKFIACLQDEKIAERVEASFQEALTAGLESTPTIFVQIKNSGKNFETVMEYTILDKIISEFLQK